MTGNLGYTTLRKRRRAANPMHTFDALPQPLRLWLANAVLPWSPVSCKRIWDRARNKGLCTDEAILILAAAEQKALARDKS